VAELLKASADNGLPSCRSSLKVDADRFVRNMKTIILEFNRLHHIAASHGPLNARGVATARGCETQAVDWSCRGVAAEKLRLPPILKSPETEAPE
jgi:hypothetical protein